RQAEQMRRGRDERDRKEKAGFEALAERIASASLKIVARAGAEGHLFGSVTTAEIAQNLERALGEDIDRRKVSLQNPIKSLGTHQFTVHLHAEVNATGSVEVVADPASPPPAKPETPARSETPGKPETPDQSETPGREGRAEEAATAEEATVEEAEQAE
ncbi:MAG: 50S ribosomal protein L9, partial [Actinomycetota bacterium]